MDQHEQRTNGIDVAKEAGAPNTAQKIGDKACCYHDILSEAVNEVGIEKTIAYVLKGPPQWSSETLRHIPGIDEYRTELAMRAAASPATAFSALRYGGDVGDAKDALVAKASEDPQWAHMTLRDADGVGDHRDILLASISRDPRVSAFALRQIDDLGNHRDAITAAAQNAG